MEDPAKDIKEIIMLLTTAINPEIQKATILKFYTPDATFRHPLCTVPASKVPPSRDQILAVYQWYRVLSPHVKMFVREVTWDKKKETLFVECEQEFHIRWSPFRPQAGRLLVKLQLREAPLDEADGTRRYLIESQEDFYHPEDLAALVLPPLVPVVHAALRFGALASALNARVFAMLGYWSPKEGHGEVEGGGGTAPQHSSGEPFVHKGANGGVHKEDVQHKKRD